MDEVPAHSHAQARGSFITLEGVLQPGPAPRFDRSVPETPRPAPALGQHTDAVLAEAGYDADAVAALRAAGVVK
jgi:alpha-methylacyl-CoA racemase